MTEPTPSMPERTDAEHFEAGMKVRREVLGDAHVDRANAGINEINQRYQEYITRNVWGDIWQREGLARRDRSISVITALVAGHHFDELRFHLLAGLRNGLTREEIYEVLLNCAVYCGVPTANTAFQIAVEVLGEEKENK